MNTERWIYSNRIVTYLTFQINFDIKMNDGNKPHTKLKHQGQETYKEKQHTQPLCKLFTRSTTLKLVNTVDKPPH